MLEKNKYKIFYSLQLLTLVMLMARSVSYGIIYSSLGATPIQLGYAASLFAGFSFIGYLCSSWILRGLKENKLFILNQIAFILIISCSIFFLYLKVNIYLWILVSSLGGFFGSLEAISRPNYVSYNFNKSSMQQLVKNDVLLMGTSKIIGFFIGGALHHVLWVFIINILGYVMFLGWLIFTYQSQPAKEIKPHKFSFSHMNMTIFLFIFFDFLMGFFIYPINTQAITIGHRNHVSFVSIFIFSSLGNLLLNGFSLNKEQKEKSYILFTIIFILGLLSLIVLRSYYVLLSSFIMGACYSGLTIYSKGRIYMYAGKSIHRDELLSVSFVIFAVSNILGTMFFSFLLSHLTFSHAIVYDALSMIVMILLYQFLYSSYFS